LSGSKSSARRTEVMGMTRAKYTLEFKIEAVRLHIRAVHAQSKGEYGWPRVCKELLARGIRVGKERVRKLMQQHGIRARGQRKFKATTDSNHSLPVAPNLLQRNFSPAAPNAVWTSDITYVPTDEG